MTKKIPDNHIVQWEDLPTAGRKIVSDNMKRVGKTMPERIAGQAATKGASTSPSAQKDAKALNAIAPEVRSRNVTIASAAKNRQDLYNRAIDAKKSEGNPSNVIPDGAGWYFSHNATIAHNAAKNGSDKPHPDGGLLAHTASAKMSPQNSPENERASVKALGDAHESGSIHVSDDVVSHLASKGIDVSQHRGSNVPVSRLPLGTLGHLSEAQFRPKVQSTGVDLKDVSRGGPKETNIAPAERILKGEEDPRTTFQNDKGVISASKIASYDHVIRSAEPGSAAHVEYMGRVHQDALARSRGATGKGVVLRGGNRYSDVDEGMTLYPEVKDHPLLNNRSHTVEDTWQNAITMNQPKKAVSTGPNPTSVFKAGGSGEQYPPRGIKVGRDDAGKKTGSAHPDARLTDAMALHAFNNKATRTAAFNQGQSTHVDLPPVAVQEVGWTQARKEAGKSRDGAGSEAGRNPMTNAEYKDKVDIAHRMGMSLGGADRSLPAQPEKPYKPRKNEMLF